MDTISSQRQGDLGVRTVLSVGSSLPTKGAETILSPSDSTANEMALDNRPLVSARILIVDDEAPNVRLLERILKRADFTNVVSTTDSRQVARIFAEFQPDLVLTDWLMPDLDGPAVIEQLGELIASDDYLPIVVLTADITPQTRQRALAIGANDFLTKPFDQAEVLLRIRNLLQARYWHVKIQEQNVALEESVRLRTIELEHALAELKGSQKQVIQQERLAALGAMAGGIAHDFNNSLCAIIGFSEILLHQARNGITGQSATKPLTMILTAAEDASQIVDRLREFYRPAQGEEHQIPIQLNKLVEQAVALTSPRWKTQSIAAGREISVKTELGQIPVMGGNGAEVREVLTNLIFNAVDAMPDGGTITLRTCCEADEVVLQISDTGTGMSEEVKARCLEPFFTTKGEKGTGLGLAMVFGIVQRHSGTIQLESRPGQGTTFTFRFPTARSQFESVASAPELANGASLYVLVVDDQPVLRQLLCEYLHSDLHRSETAENGEEALSKFREGKFDLVITDQIMAHMNGYELATELKKIRPEVPVILLTGLVDDSSQAEPSDAVDLVLGKPLSRAAFRSALARFTPL